MNSIILRARRAPLCRRYCLVPLAAALVVSGCEKPPEISTYEGPRTESRTAATVEELRAAQDHMFAAILPSGDQAWFFKLVARGAAADEVRKPFEEFIASVDARGAQPAAGGERGAAPVLPTWTLPEGWNLLEVPPTAMRAATIRVPSPHGDLQLTVSTLPLSGPWEAQLKSNVDRWMGQLQQPPLDAETIAKLARRVDTAGENATLLELVGTMAAAPMAGMAGMPAGHPPVSDRTPARPEGATPAGPVAPPASNAAQSPTGGAPPAAPSSQQGSAAPGDLVYELPEGWKEAPLGAMRRASFTIQTPAGAAEAALFVFPAVREMADPRANAVRWAGGVGLANLDDNAIRAAQSAVDFAGLEGQKFEFYTPDDAPSPSGIMAALAVQGDQVWSIKLTGSPAAVRSQSSAFNQFLASLKLPPK
ncbi:MAG TPA: hypothetical protein VEQ85_04355 [Lacipirellulaceae bacterium]|nr:hypothetical protein [Lacipirellulaceae bacterium]